MHFSGACFWIICSVNFFILLHWCRRRGWRRCNRNPKSFWGPTPKVLTFGDQPQKFWFGENPCQTWGNLYKICVNLRKIAAHVLSFQKFFQKNYCFFWYHALICYFLAIEGKFSEVLLKFGRKLCLNCLDLKTMRPVRCSRFLWRSFSLDSFSDKLAEIWTKTLCTLKTLPAPSPMFQLHGLYRWNRHRLQAIRKWRQCQCPQ